MDFLIRPSGKSLYLPVLECEVGINHYGFVDLPKIRISPDKFDVDAPLLPLLHELLDNYKDFSSRENQPTARINLLFETDGDYGVMDIEEVASRLIFTFFVRYSINDPDVARFTQRDGNIHFFNGAILDNGFPVRNLGASLNSNPERRLMDLMYIGSSGAVIPQAGEKLSEIAAYKRLVRAEKKKFRVGMRTKLKGVLQNSYILDNFNTLEKRILLSLTGGVLSYDFLLRKLQNDDYECGCMLKNPDKLQLVAGALGGLVNRGILNIATENYVDPIYGIAPELLTSETKNNYRTEPLRADTPGQGFLFTDSRVA